MSKKTTNKQLFQIYNALSGLSQQSMPVDIAIPVARNLNLSRKEFEVYMDARKITVLATGCKLAGLNQVNRDDYNKLQPEDRAKLDEAFKKIDDEKCADIKWHSISMKLLNEREDGKQIDIRPDWLAVLLEAKIIVE